jgi:hypothetical protein
MLRELFLCPSATYHQQFSEPLELIEISFPKKQQSRRARMLGGFAKAQT